MLKLTLLSYFAGLFGATLPINFLDHSLLYRCNLIEPGMTISEISPDSQIRLRPLSKQLENGVAIIGWGGQFLELPAEGLHFLTWLDEGLSLAAAQQRFETFYCRPCSLRFCRSGGWPGYPTPGCPAPSPDGLVASELGQTYLCRAGADCLDDPGHSGYGPVGVNPFPLAPTRRLFLA